MRVAAYPVLRSWADDEATWNLAEVGQSWGQPGCNDPGNDYSALPLDTTTVNALGGWYRWDVTQAARGWLSDPNTNHGLILKGLAGFEEANVQYDFTSSDSSEISHRPRLIVDYWVAP